MTTYSPTIDKEYVAILPTCTRTGKIVLVDQPSQVDVAVEALRQCTAIGFDTESKPAFQRGANNSIALLQLSSMDTAYLFRLKMIGKHEGLKSLLEDETIAKIGLSVHDDFLSLNEWMPCRPQHFIELQKYVAAYGIEEKSLQKIYAIIFHEKMSKRQRLSNWDAPELTDAQQLYAAIDAWACLDIYYHLINDSKL